MACRAEAAWPAALISFGRESGRQLTGFGRETQMVSPSGGISWAQVHRDHSLHLGNARVPSCQPHSCTSGKKGTRAERGCELRPAPRNQSSSREGLELGGLLTSRGCQSFEKGKARSERSHAHTPTTGA